MTTIRVELFGIPRERAGVAETVARGARLCEVLAELAAQFPGLSETCIEQGRLRPGFVANVDGQRFVTDPNTPLADGDSLMILSADAGG